MTSQPAAQGMGPLQQHYQQPQGVSQHLQLHQGAAAGARHPVAMGSHGRASLPRAGQVNVLAQLGMLGKAHCREFRVYLHRPAIVGSSMTL